MVFDIGRFKFSGENPVVLTREQARQRAAIQVELVAESAEPGTLTVHLNEFRRVQLILYGVTPERVTDRLQRRSGTRLEDASITPDMLRSDFHPLRTNDITVLQGHPSHMVEEVYRLIQQMQWFAERWLRAFNTRTCIDSGMMPSASGGLDDIDAVHRTSARLEAVAWACMETIEEAIEFHLGALSAEVEPWDGSDLGVDRNIANG